ncbi:MAG: thiamine phosphate synthase [Actinobacteria bacterium]|nr:thiamine phosphate synthase [Actinomycetota bacterium]
MHGLYLVTDRGLIGDRRITDVVTAAVEGGASCVQVREKDASTRELVEIATRLRYLLHSLGVPLIVNDRIDVALAVGADGVHLGQRDMDYPTARRLLGPDAVVGLSVETMEEVGQADAYDVDYLGVSPIFATPTKRDTRGAWGLDGLARVRRRSQHPLVAIGGLDVSNAAAAVEAGADAVAVVSAICAASNPRQAAAELVAQIDAAMSARS